MIESPKLDFITTELDPDILSTPFKVQTNWNQQDDSYQLKECCDEKSGNHAEILDSMTRARESNDTSSETNSTVQRHSHSQRLFGQKIRS